MPIHLRHNDLPHLQGLQSTNEFLVKGASHRHRCPWRGHSSSSRRPAPPAGVFKAPVVRICCFRSSTSPALPLACPPIFVTMTCPTQGVCIRRCRQQKGWRGCSAWLGVMVCLVEIRLWRSDAPCPLTGRCRLVSVWSQDPSYLGLGGGAWQCCATCCCCASARSRGRLRPGCARPAQRCCNLLNEMCEPDKPHLDSAAEGGGQERWKVVVRSLPN